MNFIACPICRVNKTYVVLKDYHEYDLYSCSSCHCVFCVPFVAPNFEFYTNANDFASNDRHTRMYAWHTDHPSQHSSFLKNGDGKSLLDIGCGNGAFIEFAVQKKFQAVGIDLDKRSLQLARQRKLGGVHFFEKSLVQFYNENPDKRFDVISMFEVFEHLDNPREALEIISKLLKKEGVFIGTLPNEARFFSKKINLNFALPPYHLTYWTTKTWKGVLEKYYGFETMVCENNAYYGYVSNILKNKSLEYFNVLNRPRNVLNTFIRTIFFFTRIVEIVVEKLSKKASSFYFEMKK